MQAAQSFSACWKLSCSCIMVFASPSSFWASSSPVSIPSRISSQPTFPHPPSGNGLPSWSFSELGAPVSVWPLMTSSRFV